MNASPDVLIIGAGPAGALAAARLARAGLRTEVLERTRFPRFVIGESLLPQSMDLLQEAGLLDAVVACGFQRKSGARFHHAGRDTAFHFSQQFAGGWDHTYQVTRADFDLALANAAAAKGAVIHYEETVVEASFGDDGPRVVSTSAARGRVETRPRFVLDASGYGRVLPRLLGLELPGDFPERQSLFTHVRDDRRGHPLDGSHILICIHPTEPGVWYWVIPFPNGVSSVGVVAEPAFLERYGADPVAALDRLIDEAPEVARRVAGCPRLRPVDSLRGYTRRVTRQHGPGFALLGNAAEFLDPVFSSGVTLSFMSARLASDLLLQEARGEPADWDRDFDAVMKRGVDVFRTYVRAWYDGRFPRIILHPEKPASIPPMICSILAGYVWDETNPFVTRHERRLDMLAEACAL